MEGSFPTASTSFISAQETFMILVKGSDKCWMVCFECTICMCCDLWSIFGGLVSEHVASISTHTSCSLASECCYMHHHSIQDLPIRLFHLSSMPPCYLSDSDLCFLCARCDFETNDSEVKSLSQQLVINISEDVLKTKVECLSPLSHTPRCILSPCPCWRVLAAMANHTHSDPRNSPSHVCTFCLSIYRVQGRHPLNKPLHDRQEPRLIQAPDFVPSVNVGLDPFLCDPMRSVNHFPRILPMPHALLFARLVAVRPMLKFLSSL